MISMRWQFWHLLGESIVSPNCNENLSISIEASFETAGKPPNLRQPATLHCATTFGPCYSLTHAACY